MSDFSRIQPDNASRRVFLQRASALSIAGSAAPWALSLSAMGEAAAQTATDYKALVCVFLFGGNDYANTLVPYDQTSYDAQYALRGNLRIDRGVLTPNLLKPGTALPGSRQYALAPGLDPLAPLFNAGQMAVLEAGQEVPVSTDEGATIMVLGGEPIGERFMLWNFVSSSKDRLQQAKEDWIQGRMKLPDADNQEFTPFPEERKVS